VSGDGREDRLLFYGEPGRQINLSKFSEPSSNPFDNAGLKVFLLSTSGSMAILAAIRRARASESQSEHENRDDASRLSIRRHTNLWDDRALAPDGRTPDNFHSQLGHRWNRGNYICSRCLRDAWLNRRWRNAADSKLPALVRRLILTRSVVKFFNAQKGYEFITREHQVGITERDIFVHISDLQRSSLTTLNPGQLVEYDLYEDHRGRPHVQKLKAV
jgi:CspA family cold shock protein